MMSTRHLSHFNYNKCQRRKHSTYYQTFTVISNYILDSLVNRLLWQLSLYLTLKACRTSKERVVYTYVKPDTVVREISLVFPYDYISLFFSHPVVSLHTTSFNNCICRVSIIIFTVHSKLDETLINMNIRVYLKCNLHQISSIFVVIKRHFKDNWFIFNFYSL